MSNIIMIEQVSIITIHSITSSYIVYNIKKQNAKTIQIYKIDVEKCNF